MTTGTLLAAALAAAANAATLPQPKCCFGITAYGGPGGTVGQLGDGQNRIGQNNLPVPQGTYCLNNGALTDNYGRGCIMTPPTGQFQCDVGAKPDKGFDIPCGNGTIIFKGSDTFWSCPTGDHGGWNLYDRPVEGQKKCQPVWLVADSCYSECPPPSPPPAPKTSSTKMSSSTKVSTTTKMSTSTKMTSTTKKTSSSTTKKSSSTKPTPSISKSTSTTHALYDLVQDQQLELPVPDFKQARDDLVQDQQLELPVPDFKQTALSRQQTHILETTHSPSPIQQNKNGRLLPDRRPEGWLAHALHRRPQHPLRRHLGHVRRQQEVCWP
ncbi:hypothetical protein KC331_g16256 [Hortaea werneckii]|nr:hypothetical protein KC331_g16256 [Hortaea werneckii]